MTIRQFTSDPVFRQRYWARNQVGWRHMDETLPNAGHRAVAALERDGVVTGVITQNVDLLHTKAGSQNVVNLHGTYARVVCLGCGDSMSRAALAESSMRSTRDSSSGPRPSVGWRLLPTLTPSSPKPRRSATWTVHRAAACSSPTSCTSARACLKMLLNEAFSLVDAADALLVAGSSLTVFSGYRFVRHAAALGIPVAIVNRGPTRGDDLATVKVDGGCSELLTLLAEELSPVYSPSVGLCHGFAEKRDSAHSRAESERAGHAADAVDEVAGHVGGLACLDVRQLTQQLAEDRPQLRAAPRGRPGRSALRHRRNRDAGWGFGSDPSAPDARRLRCPSCRTNRTSPPSPPPRIVWPLSSKSVAAVRRKVITGVAQRMNSSIAGADAVVEIV